MNYDVTLKALKGIKYRADLADDLGERVDSLSYIIAAILRRLRPDLALIYADQDTVMIADLLAEHGEDGLIEELLGYD